MKPKKPEDDWELFMAIYQAGDKIQVSLVRGHVPHDTKVDLTDAENLIIKALKMMGGG